MSLLNHRDGVRADGPLCLHSGVSGSANSSSTLAHDRKWHGVTYNGALQTI